MRTNIHDRVSYHAVYDASILDALHFARANGFAGIQIAVETPHLSFERLTTAEIGRIAGFMSSEGVYATLHAPDEGASLFQCSRHLSAGVSDYYQALFSFAREIDARLVTIHLGAMTVFSTDDETGRRIPEDDLTLYGSCLKQNLEVVLRLAEGIIVCVENHGLGEAEFELLEPYLGHNGLFLCWDLVKGASQPSVEARYLAHTEWIKQVHLHDRRKMASGSVKGHRTIGTGDIDFAKHLRILMLEACVEDYCIEVRPKEKAKESLSALLEIAERVEAEQPAPGDANKPRA